MDMTARISELSPGRRHAVAGLLAGTAALLSGRSTTEAKKKKKKKKSCPTCEICPAPTVCPPPAVCPERSCCICRDTSPNPGCHYGPWGGPRNTDCDGVCGGPGHTLESRGSLTEQGITTACTWEFGAAGQCVWLRCDLGEVNAVV